MKILIGSNEVELSSIPDSSITPEVHKTIRTNSEGWEKLLPKYTVETLKVVTEQYLANCERGIRSTYDYALKERLVPELLSRLEDL